MSRYRCVDAQKAAGFPVRAACEFAEVSPSAYYQWAAKRGRRPSARQRRDAEVLAEIRAIPDEHPDYGAPRVTAEIARRRKPCNHKKVEAMMAADGIAARRHRRRRGLTMPDASAPPIPDLVGRLFDRANLGRLHSTRGYLPPVEYELQLRATPRPLASPLAAQQR